MAETTQTAPVANTPAAHGWCHWHKGMGDGVRLIQVVEQGSGPGRRFSACDRCRDRFNLVPLADRP